MGPDPFNMPAWGSFNNNQALQQSTNQLAPYATQWHGPAGGVEIASLPDPMAGKTSTGGGALSKFAHFIGGVGTEIGHLAGGAATWLAKNAVDFGESIITKPAESLVTAHFDKDSLTRISAQNDQFTAKMQNLGQQFKAGNISADEYKQALKALNSDIKSLAQDADIMNNKIKGDVQTANKTAINLAADALIFAAPQMEAGMASARAFIFGTTADSLLAGAESNLGRIAANETLFRGLSDGAKAALQQSTAEVVANSAKMTSGQIARSAVMNLAIKYPIYYNYLSSTGGEIYNQLDNKKYGDAVRTVAFNAALLLSGGPIGQALKYGKTGAGAVLSRTFARSTFIDELSKGLFNDPAALYLAAKDNPEYIKGLSSLEATHLARTSGDPVTAAWNVINGEASVDGLNAIDKGPAGWLEHNTNWAQASKEFTDEAKRLGIPNVVAGRWTVAQAKRTAQEFAGTDNKEAWQAIWKNIKAKTPNAAIANNQNLEAQVQHYMTTSSNGAELAAKIQRIKAGGLAKGIDSVIIKKWGEKGFVPVTIPKVATPFVEGTGKIASKFAEDTEFFTKAVQPVPVLSSVGKLLTNIGLSPYASQQRVYQMFTDNLALNLKETSATSSVLAGLNSKIEARAVKVAKTTTTKVAKAEDAWAATGLSKEDIAYAKKYKYTPEEAVRKFSEGGVGKVVQRAAEPAETIQKPILKNEQDATDYMIKRLSDYAHKPTRGRIVSRMPISDLRMLTLSDIRLALKVSNTEAKEVQRAISRSFLQVPMTVRGLGDRAVDRLYGIRPTGAIQRRYLRVMGAARFSWNPFFQYLRVIPKTETLAEFEGGGFVNSVFAGRLGEIKNVREGLRAGKFFDKESGFNVISGEATDFAGSMTHNLSKKLLPMQERSIAGLVDAQARRMGMDWQDYIKEYPQQVRDTIQAIAEYDRRGDFINSPLMRTLNIAFFPLRFDVKVAQIMARSLSKTSLMTQVSIVNGMLRAHDWLNSPEGQAWYSQNADVIGLLEYVSPFAKMNEVFQSLVPGHDHSLGNFGEVGGLPFGWIPQMLDSEGLTHFNQPGVNPKTGAIYQDYIPITARGQLATALQDFIGSLYSYPGATIGLESKGKVNRFIAGSIIPTSTKKDFNVTTPQVSGQQQDYSSLIQQLSSTNPQQVKPFPTAPMRPGVSVPNTAPPMPSNKGPASAKSGTKKKKKADFTPELLPGQTTFGQL